MLPKKRGQKLSRHTPLALLRLFLVLLPVAYAWPCLIVLFLATPFLRTIRLTIRYDHPSTSALPGTNYRRRNSETWREMLTRLNGRQVCVPEVRPA